jgi:hypothetical protein
MCQLVSQSSIPQGLNLVSQCLLYSYEGTSSSPAEEIESLIRQVKVVNADIAAAMRKKKMFCMAIEVMVNDVLEIQASHSAEKAEIFRNMHGLHDEVENIHQSVEAKGEELLTIARKVRDQVASMSNDQRKRWSAAIKVGLDMVRANETDEGMW